MGNIFYSIQDVKIFPIQCEKKWLIILYLFVVINEREREIVVQRLKEDAGPSNETEFSWVQFRAAFTDWRVYAHSLVYICGSTPLYSLSLFLPSIIQGMGFTNLRAQAMTAPPYAIGKNTLIYF